LIEPLDVISQLREVPAAERSEEAAQEHEDDRAGANGFGQMKLITVLVAQGEVRGGLANGRGTAVDAHVAATVARGRAG
jgi:hypothetical protein